MSMSRKELELRVKELFDAEYVYIKRIQALESLLRECADDIECYVNANYPNRDAYPTDMYKYNRDIEIVRRARALMAGPALEPEPADQRGASVAAALARTFTGAQPPVLPRQPYPMCRHPSVCAWAGYCKHDPACNN